MPSSIIPFAGILHHVHRNVQALGLAPDVTLENVAAMLLPPSTAAVRVPALDPDLRQRPLQHRADVGQLSQLRIPTLLKHLDGRFLFHRTASFTGSNAHSDIITVIRYNIKP